MINEAYRDGKERPLSQAIGAAAPDFPRQVLLVEDNVLIAMDVESMLEELGAVTILTASTIGEAQEFAEQPIDFAILDLHLGSETSLPIAKALGERGISFVFASGDGDQAGLTDGLAAVPVIMKPYRRDDILAAWREVRR